MINPLNKKEMKTVKDVRKKLRKLNNKMFSEMAEKFSDNSMKEILNNYNELKPLWEATTMINKKNTIEVAEQWFSTHLFTQMTLHGGISNPLILINHTTAKLIGGNLAIGAENVISKLR